MDTTSLTVNEKWISLVCGTTAIFFATSFFLISSRTSPSNNTQPPHGLRFLLRFFRSVVLPHPFGPSIPRISPLPTVNDIPSRTMLFE